MFWSWNITHIFFNIFTSEKDLFLFADSHWKVEKSPAKLYSAVLDRAPSKKKKTFWCSSAVWAGHFAHKATLKAVVTHIVHLRQDGSNINVCYHRGTPPLVLEPPKTKKSCGPSTPWLLDTPAPFSHSGWTLGAKKLRSLHPLALRHTRSLDQGGG
jgi:hypothetical protein